MSKVHWFAPFKGVFAPVVKDPNEGPFLCVTFNVDYAPFIRGALLSMLQRQMWSGSAAEVDLMIMKVHQLLYMFGQLTSCALPADLTGEYEEMASLCESLRIQDGKLQALCCGDWTDIDGQDGKGLYDTPGPTEETPPSGEGGQKCYRVNLAANMQAVLPFYVSTGDVLTFSNAKGAGQDQANGLWYCANGNFYIAGACRGINSQDGADPLPSDYHMSVVFQLAGSFYTTGADFTVPAGVHNEPVTFQANDSNLSDNSGGWSFDVCLTNNQVEGAYAHRFDFAFGPLGWQVQGANGAGWSAGAFQGIITITASENRIFLNMAAGLSITSIDVDVDLDTSLSGGIESDAYTGLNCSGSGTLLYLQGLSNGSTADRATTVSFPISLPSNTQSILIQLSGEITATYNKQLAVTFHGNGADPFV